MSLQQQFLILASMVLNSFFIGIVFDGYRVLKGMIRLPAILVFIVDVLFGVFAAIFTFGLLLNINNGQLRLSIFIIFFLGLWVYYKTISDWFVLVWIRIYKLILYLYRVITSLFNWTIVKPIKFLYQLILVVLTFLAGVFIWIFQLFKRISVTIFKKAKNIGVASSKKIQKKVRLKAGISSFFKKLFRH